MAKLYYQRITEGTMTIKEVPSIFYSKTVGYFRDRVADGTITEDQYKLHIGENY